MSEKDGGPAFPGEGVMTIRHPEGGDETCSTYFGGMTLRDWYKGQALAGFVPTTSERALWLAQEAEHRGVDGYAVIAENCGRLADAMLAEGEGREEL